MVAGVALCVGGLALGSRRVRHTDYRPDPWALPEWLVVGAGLTVAVTFVVAGHVDPSNLIPSLSPLDVAAAAPAPGRGHPARRDPGVHRTAAAGAGHPPAGRRARRARGGGRMIEFDRMTVTYPDATTPTLRDVTFTVPEGELCLVVGRTGSGKSTLLGAVNGLVPTFTGGVLAGRVRVDGRDTSTHHPARPRRRGGGRWTGPDGRIRHRHGRRGARLRHGATRASHGHDAHPGRGDHRRARPGRAARPGAVRALRRPAAASGDRFGAGDASRRCSCSTSRPPRWTRPRPRRCWRRSPGSCTTWA